jgi:hypothetical protein
MFLLYHSEGCNICGGLFRKCYINDLHNTTCSGMLGYRKYPRNEFITFSQHSSIIKLQIDTSFQNIVDNIKLQYEIQYFLRYNSLLHGAATAHSQTFTE